jgi:puromycin-sensitive aminopeptidase
MWFGDLVTMGWWEGIWLNEAFATFMEMLCTDAFKPTWERWTSFGLEKEMALAVDGLHTTRAIEYEVHSPEDANGMFDVLTYEKGGSVLRMLQQYLGETTFRDGVRIYLKRHAYANTVTTDLWDAIEEASGKPVRQIMDTWILQGGHPLITVEDGIVRQSPFSYGPPLPGTTSAIGALWQVPLLTRNLASHSVTATQLGAEPVNLGNGPGSVLANAGGSGVYRVAYAPADAAVIAGSLSSLQPLERAVLMNDAFATTVSGAMELSDFFHLAANLGQDDEPATWGAVVRALTLLSRVAAPDERSAVAEATVALLLEKATALGWEPKAHESERTPGLRAVLIGALGTIGHHQPTIEEAISRFNGHAPLNADVEPAILEIVGNQNRPGAFDHILERFQNPANPQQEMTYLYALAGFPDSARAAQVFAMARTEIRTQNAPFFIAQLLANRTTGAETWDLVERHFAELLERFPTNSHPRMLGSLPALCGAPDTARRATAFLLANPLKSGQQTVLQGLERLAINVAFGERVGGTLTKTLRDLGLKQ